MKLAAAFVLLAACTEHGSRPHLDVNVTVTPDVVRVYRPDADLCCTATDPLPAAGQCAHLTDTSSCTACDMHPSCFTAFDIVDEHDKVLIESTPDANNTVTLFPASPSSGQTLVAVGCGDDVRVPLTFGGPKPMQMTNGNVVTWTTDKPAAGALVTADQQRCWTTSSMFTFDHEPGVLEVFTFDPPTVTETPNVTMTLYTGNRDGFVPL